MNKDTINLIKEGADTMLNITQMTQSRMRYLQDRNAEDKEKMVKYTLLSVAGIACLLTIGIVRLIESCRNDYIILDCHW